jgi:hypothetical protein
MTSLKSKNVLLGLALLLGLTLGGGHASARTASSAWSALQSQEPVFCYGADEFGKCRLFAGTAESCRHVEPCDQAKLTFIPQQGLTFCYGADQFDRCQLYLGTEQACKSLNPC